MSIKVCEFLANGNYEIFNECMHLTMSDIRYRVILALISIFLLMTFSFYILYTNIQKEKFIKDKKLEKSFQEWKQDNKGL